MAISQIVQNSLANTISLGPKITSVQVANSTYVVKDDTAVNIGGGYIVITGSGFQSNCSVIVDSNLACSVAFVSATQVRAELPSKAAGTYNIYLLNGDGGTAIRVNAIQYSNTPIWVTTSPLADQAEDSAVSIQLSATGANTYVLQTGSTLPTGLTLSANGLISGTVNTNVSVTTTYNFTVEAIDTENQETPKAFAVTITVGEPDFYRTTLLLDGDGTSGANNNVFRDSSNSNFTITRVGSATQGSFSPFSPAGWSNYFDGNADYLRAGDNSAFHLTGDFTIEAWVFQTANQPLYDGGVVSYGTSSALAGWFFGLSGSNAGGTLNRLIWSVNYSASGGAPVYGTAGVPLNQWTHIAASKSGNTVRLFINGVLDTTATVTATPTTNASYYSYVGTASYDPGSTDRSFIGYISNLRVVKGQALYTEAFTPSTIDLTTTSQNASSANVSLLTAQSNRFKDNSNNGFAFTVNGNPKVTNFSPFKPTSLYSTSAHGGSAYFRGASNADGLTVASNTAFNLSNGNFTVEAWVYPTATFTVSDHGIFSIGENLGTRKVLQFNGYGTNIVRLSLSSNGSSYDLVSLQDATTVNLNSWTHLAVVRNGATVTVWRNGSNVAAFGVSTSSLFNDTELGVSVGNYRNSGSLTASSFPGYISGVRLLKGTALYTTAFTPPTEPPSPIADTQLILNYTNAGILDYTTKNVIETANNVSVNTSVTKWGTGSIYFGSVNNYLYSKSSEAFRFGTGDFTIEGWYYFNSLSSYPCLFDSRTSNPGSDGCAAFVNSSGQIELYSGQSFASGGSPVSTGTWTHIAFVRQSGNLKVYVNGTQVGSTTAYGSNMTNTYYWIGRYLDLTSTSYPLEGNIDDFRVSKFARYTGNFTAPTAAFLKS